MRLLVVEDEKELSHALVAILKHNNYSVDAVYNGADALDFIESSEYDAVILDIMIPFIDGISVLKRVREKGISVPVLLLTARSELDDKVAGLDAGADDYLTKPFEVKELLARIRAITRRVHELPITNLSFGNVTLSRSTYELSTPTGKTKLANKEFQMLEMLMTNPENVISTERFFEKIWGLDSDAEINVVWVYISYIRKKLVSLDASINIKAQRNTGYSLEVIEK